MVSYIVLHSFEYKLKYSKEANRGNYYFLQRSSFEEPFSKQKLNMLFMIYNYESMALMCILSIFFYKYYRSDMEMRHIGSNHLTI